MAEIPLKEYALMHGIDPSTARQRAARGAFKTTRKVGRDWVIDSDEPLIDHRKAGGTKEIKSKYYVIAEFENSVVNIENVEAESEQAAVDNVRKINNNYVIRNVFKLVKVNNWR